MALKLKRALQNPALVLNYILLMANGFYYRVKFKILRKRVEIGKNFKVNKKLSIRGPGKVIIGDNVYIDGTSNPVTPWTYSRDALIRIGNNTFLNGTRFGCLKKIEIGDDCIIADCRIIDTDFHSVYADKRNDPEYVKSEPIEIGDKVWISLGCVILRGVKIGNNSTISAQSVVYNDVPENCVFGGNPAVLIKRLSSKNKGLEMEKE